ncbi:MAG: methyltransferase domain-containing protein, partial [Bacteroidota bacterium]
MLLTRPNPNPLLRRLHLARPQVKQEVLDHYEVAGPDYAYWSRAFNMHFGYFAWGMNPFKLEPMLERMNAEALDRLGLPEEQESLIGDLGCGLGATSRYAARRFGAATVLGFTVVPWQVEQGNQLHEAAGLDDQAHVFQGDFRALPLPDNSLDGVVALESSCYGTGEDKADFLAEVYRVLKPGGRFVVADVFRKHSKPLPGLIA